MKWITFVRSSRGARGVLLGSVVALGCAEVFDLEEGELDPTAGLDAGALCELYCLEVTSTCIGDMAVYQNGISQCRQMCPLFEDQLACRYRVLVASGGTSQRERCAAAGPGGVSMSGEGCGGDLCSNYCQLMKGMCPQTGLGMQRDDGTPTASDDSGLCTELCSLLPVLDGSDIYLSTRGAGRVPVTPIGDNVQCRIFHIGNAASDEPRASGEDSSHCEHAAGRAGFCLESLNPTD